MDKVSSEIIFPQNGTMKVQTDTIQTVSNTK